MGDPIVQLESGQIRGVVEKHEDGFDYYAFRGIPYAEPPIGELRFQDPVAKKPWTEVIDCKNYGPMCLQYDMFFRISSTEENCLFMNVFTRSIDGASENKPVIFVIHGGAFMFGRSDDFLYGPDYLIRKNIVLVTFNYRLGVLGFLNLEDQVAPGNQGLKDQLLALEWVQKNIRRFGGDPNNVTVLGVTAGAACAHQLTVSPLSKGLFHKVIYQGAVVYDPWAMMISPKSKAIELCSVLGRNLTDAAEILRFLKTVDADTLQRAQESVRLAMDGLPFVPCVDDKAPNPVMPIDPVLAADRGVHLPCLIGYNSNEGILGLLEEVSFPGSSSEEFFRKCDADPETLFRFNTKVSLQRYGLSAAQLRKLYYKNERVSDRNAGRYIDLVSDFYFAEAIHRFCRVQAEQSSAATYLYVFSYDPPDSLSNGIIKNAPDGAAHLDELPYFFKMGALQALGVNYAKKGTRQYRMMEQVTEMWTNFARYGKPTVDKTDLTPVHWTPVRDGTLLRYLNIDEDFTMQSTINLEEKFKAAKDIRV